VSPSRIDGSTDIDVSSTAAKMSTEHLVLRNAHTRAGTVGCDKRHHDARSTEAALKSVFVVHGGLNRVIITLFGDTLNGLNRRTIGLDCQHQTRPLSPPVDDYRACAARSLFTPNVCTGETEFVPQRISEE